MGMLQFKMKFRVGMRCARVACTEELRREG